jgi:hypothetical protein
MEEGTYLKLDAATQIQVDLTCAQSQIRELLSLPKDRKGNKTIWV